MKGKAQLSALLAVVLSATLLLPSACAYENTQYGFSITSPEGWAIEENTDPDSWSEVTRFTKEATFQTTQSFTVTYPEWRIRWQYETGVPDEHPSLHIYVYPQATPGTWFESITKSGNEDTNGTLYIHDRKGGFCLVVVSATPNFTIVVEQKIPYPSVVFRDPSNQTGATISVSVNQSGLPQDDPFLASLKQSYLRHYLSQAYEGCLITQRGARVVGNLNGYQVKFNASVGGSEMRFDSVVFIETNRTFYIVCGALSPAYDNLSTVFKDSIDSFRITSTSQSEPPSAPPDNFVLLGVLAIAVLMAIVVIALFILRRQRQKTP
jgi:hypothetical protein